MEKNKTLKEEFKDIIYVPVIQPDGSVVQWPVKIEKPILGGRPKI